MVSRSHSSPGFVLMAAGSSLVILGLTPNPPPTNPPHNFRFCHDPVPGAELHDGLTHRVVNLTKALPFPHHSISSGDAQYLLTSF